MTELRRTPVELLDDVSSSRALCAFNVENFDTLLPAVRAASSLDAPIIISWTVPAARYLGYQFVSELVHLLTEKHGVRHALHLDHCEDPTELRLAAAAGFTSANFLNEGALTDESYRDIGLKLRDEFSSGFSLEYILGTLGHHPRSEYHHGDGDHVTGASEGIIADEVVEFSSSLNPDILGFHCGSLHGMRNREQLLDIDLIQTVSERTQKPIVLHGSSGVVESQVIAAIDAGVRKINIETAIRIRYLDAVRTAVSPGGPAEKKPRYMTMATDDALTETYTGFIERYTLR